VNLRLVSPRLASVAAIAACTALAGCGSDRDPARAPVERPDSGTVTDAICPNDVPYFSRGVVAAGESGVLRALLVDTKPSSPAQFLNVWTLEFQTTDGAAAGDAEVTQLETFMPVHGHPGQPAATAEPMGEPGRYRAELHFTMRGPWQVRLDVASPSAGSDHFVFEVCVGG
jgi:hypothetical protein